MSIAKIEGQNRIVWLYRRLLKSWIGITGRNAIGALLSDKAYLERRYFAEIGRKIDWDNPTGFNEKLQWIKVYDRNPDYIAMVDKVAAKEYAAGIIGDEYIVPTLGVWDSADEVDFSILPDKFAIKCNHNSGTGAYICTDKKAMDESKVRKGLKRGLKENYFLWGREWAYRDVERKIIAEQYLETDGELVDYKLMCFNGKVKCSFVCSDRFSNDGLKVTFFDNDWNVLPFDRHYPRSAAPIAQPGTYSRMVELAEQLSKDIPFARIDFYDVNGKIYFGEITLYPGNGMEEFSPEEWDYTLGSWIELPEK